MPAFPYINILSNQRRYFIICLTALSHFSSGSQHGWGKKKGHYILVPLQTPIVFLFAKSLIYKILGLHL